MFVPINHAKFVDVLENFTILEDLFSSGKLLESDIQSFWKWDKASQHLLEKCIKDYTFPKGVKKSVIHVLWRVFQSVKAVFGFSEWQIARNQLAAYLALVYLSTPSREYRIKNSLGVLKDGEFVRGVRQNGCRRFSLEEGQGLQKYAACKHLADNILRSWGHFSLKSVNLEDQSSEDQDKQEMYADNLRTMIVCMTEADESWELMHYDKNVISSPIFSKHFNLKSNPFDGDLYFSMTEAERKKWIVG